MLFNWPLFLKQTFATFGATENTHIRKTPRRILFLLFFYPLYAFLQLVTRFSFFLDELFFPGYHRMDAESPVFIVGNYRSGSTFLQRMLHRDSKHFTSLKSWEIYTAPSLTQRKLIRIGMIVERVLGSPFFKLLHLWDREYYGNIQLHPIGIWKPEEDEGLFLYFWESIFTWFFFPHPGELPHAIRFDKKVNRLRRRRIMGFYKRCHKRHLYASKKGRRILSKNPALTSRIDSLYETFKNPKFINLVRDPKETLNSVFSLFSLAWHFFGNPMEKYPFKEEVIALVKEYYLYPYNRFEKAPEKSYIHVKYDDLVKDPRKTIEDIYRHLDIEITTEFRYVLEKEAARAKSHRPQKHTALQEIGITDEYIKKEFQEVYDLYQL